MTNEEKEFIIPSEDKEMNTKYQVNQKVTWQDANKQMTGTIIRINNNRIAVIVVKDTNRHFQRPLDMLTEVN